MNDKISLINGNNDIEENDNFVLHQCIFEGDIEKLSLILKTFKDISIKDHHGNYIINLIIIHIIE